VWHPTVQYFEVFRSAASTGAAAGEQLLAGFFVDPYTRPAEKRGGAWMDAPIARSNDPALVAPDTRSAFVTTTAVGADSKSAPVPVPVRVPIAYLVCNQSAPVEASAGSDARPSLMTFREVETLFHEFGHCLQHLLTRVDSSMAAGIALVEWDAVELPSQMMENFCYRKATIQALSAHYQTGEPVPDALYDKIVAARTFRAGTALCRQLYFSGVDMHLHAHFVAPSAPTPAPAPAAAADSKSLPRESYDALLSVEQQIGARTQVLPILPENRLLTSFLHIFAGGYSAGYYSYKWAEVMSADAFEAFVEAERSAVAAVTAKSKSAAEVAAAASAALKAVGTRFAETVLGLGGSVPAGEVFRRFRGRDPSVTPLLRHNGLLTDGGAGAASGAGAPAAPRS
jgi:oligopeptidase A